MRVAFSDIAEHYSRGYICEIGMGAVPRIGETVVLPSGIEYGSGIVVDVVWFTRLLPSERHSDDVDAHVILRKK